MFEELFEGRKVNINKLLSNDFFSEGCGYKKVCSVMNGEFDLHILIDKNGYVETNLFECSTNEQYTLYKSRAEGAYIGAVRQAVSDKLLEVSNTCYDSAVFTQLQTSELLEYAKKMYDSSPEFMWENTPKNAILRRRESGKWYAVIMTISESKLGFGSEKQIEAVNLHASKALTSKLLEREHFYPAWHMNKNSWYTVILDGSVKNSELFSLLDISYELAKK